MTGLWWLLACSGSPGDNGGTDSDSNNPAAVDAETAGTVMRDLNRLFSEIRARIESVETQVPTRHAAGDGNYAYVGLIPGFMWWTGNVAVDGVGVWSDQGATANLVLDLDLQTIGIDELVFSGSCHATIDLSSSAAGLQQIGHYIGNVQLSAPEPAEFDFDFVYTSIPNEPTTYSGSVGGYDAATL